MAPTLDDDPLDRSPRRDCPVPYSVVVRSTRRQGDVPLAVTDLVETLAARLGVAMMFDDLGYEAAFTIVADDDLDAMSVARRRWFYLASDLEIPSWPVTDVVVTLLPQTQSVDW
jgi:hypothetical protein